MRRLGAPLACAVLCVAARARADAPAEMTVTPSSPLPVEPDRGWMGVGGRNAIGASPVDPDFGVYAYGGAWFWHEHVQPFIRAGWSRGWSGHGSSELLVDSARLGAGVLAGSAFADDHLWLGGGLGVEGVVGVGHGDVAATTSGDVVIPVIGVLQVRLARRLLIGLDVGPEFWPAPVHFSNPSERIEWSGVRVNAGLLLGVVLGRPVGARQQ